MSNFLEFIKKTTATNSKPSETVIPPTYDLKDVLHIKKWITNQAGEGRSNASVPSSPGRLNCISYFEELGFKVSIIDLPHKWMQVINFDWE